MKALIVDDEPKAREVLSLMIHHHLPEISEVFEAGSADEATTVVGDGNPDLVFLDIKMPGKDGFEWLQSLKYRNFDVIFTTAYDQYAIKAIRYSAFDYLLKPVDIEDLKEAMARLKEVRKADHASFENLFYNAAQHDPAELKLTISTSEGIHYLKPETIIRCEADGSYTHFYTSGSEHIMASKPLGHFAGLLPEEKYIRCHKSHLVNLDFVRAILNKHLVLMNGEEIEISRRRMHAVKQLLAPRERRD